MLTLTPAALRKIVDLGPAPAARLIYAYNLDKRITDLRRVVPDVTEDTPVPLRTWWDLPTTDVEDRWGLLRAVEPGLEGQRLGVRAACLAARRVLPMTRDEDRPVGPKPLRTGDRMTPEQIRIVLADHEAWMIGDASKTRADLTRADLRGAKLNHVNLSGAKLSGAKLSGAKLSGADMSGANLSGADLSLADLTRANLIGADLSGACLALADLTRADLRDADLIGVDLDLADLTRANLTGAKGIASEAEETEMLLRIRDILLPRPDRLDTDTWHGPGWSSEPERGDCGTTHCLAGWAQALSTDPEVRKLDPWVAGSLLLPRHARLFYRTEEEVLEVLRSLPVPHHD